jgi:hypothetical protein
MTVRNSGRRTRVNQAMRVMEARMEKLLSKPQKITPPGKQPKPVNAPRKNPFRLILERHREDQERGRRLARKEENHA